MCVMCVPVCSDTLQFLLWHRDLWRHLGSSSSSTAAPIYGAALSEVTLYSSTLVTAWVNIQEDEVVTFFIFGGIHVSWMDWMKMRECVNKLFGPPDPTTHHSPVPCTPHILQLHKVKCKNVKYSSRGANMCSVHTLIFHFHSLMEVPQINLRWAECGAAEGRC